MDDISFVRERLKASPRNLRQIAESAGVGHSWLRMFARGEIPNPGYNQVKALLDDFRRIEPSSQPIAAPPPRETA